MKIYLGSDHAGCRTKEHVKRLLTKKGLSFEDLSLACKPGDDYADHAFAVAKKVARSKARKGILICGSGTGMVMAANRVRGIRAAMAYDAYSARMSRKDNDANILALRGRQFPLATISKIVNTWLTTPFSGLARHKRRIKKLDKK